MYGAPAHLDTLVISLPLPYSYSSLHWFCFVCRAYDKSTDSASLQSTLALMYVAKESRKKWKPKILCLIGYKDVQ